MSPTITSGLYPASSSASAPPSTAISTGLKSRMYGAHHAQVALVARAARDDERVAVAEARRERREVDAFRKQLSLLAEVAHRVLGERLQRFGHASALLAQRTFELGSSSMRPVARHVPLR